MKFGGIKFDNLTLCQIWQIKFCQSRDVVLGQSKVLYPSLTTVWCSVTLQLENCHMVIEYISQYLYRVIEVVSHVCERTAWAQRPVKLKAVSMVTIFVDKTSWTPIGEQLN